jgi:alpha-tubulin suppressor-like RCC1 family protein
MNITSKHLLTSLLCVALTACPAPDTTPPTVSLASSRTAILVGETVNLTVTASDERGIERVEMLEDGAFRVTDTTSPYDFTANNLTRPGPVTFTARAFDLAGNSSEDSVTVNVSAKPTPVPPPPPKDESKPVVHSFNATPSSPAIGTATTLRLEATDNVGITRVTLLSGSTILLERTAPVFPLEIQTPAFDTPGVKTIAAKLEDSAGNRTTVSFALEVRDVTPPVISSFTLSENPVLINQNAIMTVVSSDNVGVKTLELLEGNAVLQTRTDDSAFSFSVKMDRAGQRRFTVRVRDAAGLEATRTLDVQTDDPAQTLAAGGNHTCALLLSGNVRCWGRNDFGQLGFGTPGNPPATVNLGMKATAITAGQDHTCALLEDQTVRCWGNPQFGRLGHANGGVAALPDTIVDVGAKVTQISAGTLHTCALLFNGKVRCWGAGASGRLGYGNINNIGDDETPASAGDISIGGDSALAITAGGAHSCALLLTRRVRCWGDSAFGALGHGNGTLDEDDIGNNELPTAVNELAIQSISEISAGEFHNCVVTGVTVNTVKCWGEGSGGRLGYGNQNDLGGDTDLQNLEIISLGTTAIASVSAGLGHSCALLRSGEIKCWGSGNFGQLGYNNTVSIGDNEPPSSVSAVQITSSNEKAIQVVTGNAHTCALLESNRVKCWGANANGELGNGNTVAVGDNPSRSVSSASFVNLI